MGKKNKKTKKTKKSDTFKKAQAQLNELEASERIIYLTDKQRTTIVDQILQHHVNEQDDRGKALYSEYVEILDEECNHEDYEEAFWVSSAWLQELLDEKRFHKYWRDNK